MRTTKWNMRTKYVVYHLLGEDLLQQEVMQNEIKVPRRERAGIVSVKVRRSRMKMTKMSITMYCRTTSVQNNTEGRNEYEGHVILHRRMPLQAEVIKDVEILASWVRSYKGR